MRGDLLEPLGRVLRDAREAAGATQIEIAVRADVSQQVVSRMEIGERWPEVGPDRLVAAYASECGLASAELWRRAVARL